MDAGPPPAGGPSASGVPFRLRLDVSYLGGGYRGFAENRGVRTVAGDLRAALERVLGRPCTLTCAGRTDAGVHARAQVVTVEVGGGPAREPDLRRLRDSVNALVGPDTVVAAVAPAADGFDARHSARSRSYRYLVLNQEVPDPFLAATAWWVPARLDRVALAEACPPLLGEHDFSSFCRRPRGVPDVSLVRRVVAAGWQADDDRPELLRFEITATAFCHQMVRSIVGMLVDVGRGRRTPADVAAALAARDRSTTAHLAPPHGLTLWSVAY